LYRFTNCTGCQFVITNCDALNAKLSELAVTAVVWRCQCGMHGVGRCCQSCLSALLSWTCNSIAGQSYHWHPSWILSEVRCCEITLCLKKNIPDVFSYNSRKHWRIFI